MNRVIVMWVLTYAVSAGMLVPTMGYSHGHPQVKESRSISEAYGLSCKTALHEVFKHPAIAKTRVIPGGVILEVEFPDSPDLVRAIAEIMAFWDYSGMRRWQGEYKDAVRFPDAGPHLRLWTDIRVTHFRNMRQDVCDHRRKKR